jgi:hypothetical protein
MTIARTDAFVPLTSAQPARPGELTEFRATVVSNPGAMQKFQAVEVSAPARPGSTPAVCSPRVNVQRDGDRVTGIHIQCSCGQVIDLSCLYEAAPAVPKPEAPKSETPKAEAPPAEAAASVAAPSKSAKPEPAPGKNFKASGKDLPKAAAKGQKKPEKDRGTSSAKRR